MDGAQSIVNFIGAHNAGLQVGQHIGTLINLQRNDSDRPGLRAALMDVLYLMLLDFRGDYFYIALTTAPNFVARVKHRTQIENQLLDQEEHRKQKLLVITGLGGSGKSQLVLDYLSNHGDKYAGRFWIDAQSVTSIERDFTHIFAILFPAEQIPSDFDIVLSRVKLRFQREVGKTLVIFDGADVFDEASGSLDLRRYLPRLPGVHIIITSRRSDMRHLSDLVPVCIQEMEDAEARQLLRKCSGLSDQEGALDAIVKELENFPLAIALAGCHIARDPDMMANVLLYLQKLREKRSEVLAWRPNALVNEYKHTTLSTWELSYECMKRESPFSARLLSCFSFFARTGLSSELFREHGFSDSATENVDPIWKSVLSPSGDVSLGTIKEAFATITAFSFASPSQNTISMHRLVHEWGILRLGLHERESYSYETTAALQSIVRETSLHWEARLRIAPHIVANLEIIRATYVTLNADQLSALNGLSDLAAILYDAGYWQQHLDIKKYVHTSYLTHFGENDQQAIDALVNFAIALSFTGDHRKARLLFEKAFLQRRDSLGEENGATVDVLAAMARSILLSGYPQEAAALARQVAEIRLRQLGQDHQTTVTANAQHANILYILGHLKDAEAIQQDALAIARRILPRDHALIIDMEYEFAYILVEQEKHREAKYSLEQIITSRSHSFGSKHPLALMAQVKYSEVLLALGSVHEAIAIQRKAIEQLQLALGNDHPFVWAAKHSLAMALKPSGNLDEAISLEKDCIETYQVMYGENFRDTQAAKYGLALMLCDQGRMDEASKLLSDLNASRRKLLGIDHIAVLETEAQYAFSLHQLGRDEEALSILEPLLKRSTELHGKDSNVTLTIMGYLGSSLASGRGAVAAATIQVEVLERRRKMFGDDHLDTIGAMINLANSLNTLDKGAEALQLAREAYGKSRNTLGENHFFTMEATLGLATALRDCEEYDEAQDLCLRVLPKSEKYYGLNHSHPIRTRLMLATILQGAGKTDEAIDMFRALTIECRQGAGNEYYLYTIRALAKLLHDRGDSEEAIALLRQARQVEGFFQDTTDEEVLFILLNLASYLTEDEQSEGAIEIIREIDEHIEKFSGNFKEEFVAWVAELLQDIQKLQERQTKKETSGSLGRLGSRLLKSFRSKRR